MTLEQIKTNIISFRKKIVLVTKTNQDSYNGIIDGPFEDLLNKSENFGKEYIWIEPVYSANKKKHKIWLEDIERIEESII